MHTLLYNADSNRGTGREGVRRGGGRGRRRNRRVVESDSSDNEESAEEVPEDDAESEPEDDTESEPDSDNVDNCSGSASDASSSDDEVGVSFEVGNKVRNIRGLNGVVTAVVGKLYDVKYTDGRTDRLKRNQLKAPVVRKSSAPRLSSAGNYSIIAHHADQWVGSSSILGQTT